MKFPNFALLGRSNIPGPLRKLLADPRRQLPIPVVLIVLAILALSPSGSGPGQLSTNPSDELSTEPGNTGEVGPAGGGSPLEGSTGTQTAATGGKRRGGLASGGSGSGNSVGGTLQGVTSTEVKVVFAYMPEPCGQDPTAFANQVAGAGDPEASIANAVQYFNDRALEIFGPDMPSSLKSQLGQGYYGRKVKPIVVTDRGDFCAELSQQDARDAADKHQPFANIGGSNEWDNIMPSKRILRVSGRPALDKYFLDRRPYLWGPITGASDINDFLGGYVGSYLKGKAPKDTGDLRVDAATQRTYGIIYHDDPETKAGVDDLIGEIGKRGVKVAKAVGYEPNLGTIDEQSRSVMEQFVNNNPIITSILMVMDPIAVSFMSTAADRQQYRPEWISSTWGLADGSVIPRTFMSRLQQSNVFGISSFFPSRQIEEEGQEAYLAWKKMHPESVPPSDWAGWYLQAKLIFRGIALAGPNLSPSTFEQGMNKYCNPCSRLNPKDPLQGWGPNDFTAVDDAHIQTFDPDAPDRTAPKTCSGSAESASNCWAGGQPPRGAYVYDNDGLRYRSFD